MTIPLDELFVFVLLLLGVVGVYYALKLHYVFAFGLVTKTSIDERKKQKIEKIKSYVFIFLKVLLGLGLVGMFTFGSIDLAEGISLKHVVFSYWQQIPEGFWLHMLVTLVRISVLIVLMRYVLKWIFASLDKHEEKTQLKKRYNANNIRLVYLRIHNMIKYTFVLGVVYRIIHFFPFLAEVSEVFLGALILFFISALLITLREVVLMRKTRN